MTEENVNNNVSDGTEQNVPITPALKSYTQDELNNLMAREKGTGERSVLKIIGASTKEEAQAFVSEHNELKTKYETVSRELDKLKNQSLLASKGVQADFMDYVMFEVGKLVDQKTDFGAAADKFLEGKPVYKGANVAAGANVATGAGMSQTAHIPKTANEIINERIRNQLKRGS